MPIAKANNIELEYETFGNPSSEPMLLIAGNSAQMLYWREEFCSKLAELGFWVIRYDNRDTGLSTKFQDWDDVDLSGIFSDIQQGKDVDVPYTIFDMAADAIGILDFLKIDKAHIFGHSLGAYMSLIIALRYPSRVLTLVPFSTNAGNLQFPLLTTAFAFTSSIPDIKTNYEEYITSRVLFQKKLEGGVFPFDEEKAREYVTRKIKRAHSKYTTFRHSIAIRLGGNLKSQLKDIKIPTLVIQGTEDVIVSVEGGEDTAKSIPGARFLLIDGMGHNYHPLVYKQIINAVVKLREQL